MLRGFRWQLLALLAAVALFIVALVLRSTDTPPSPELTVTAAPTATNLPVENTAAPTPESSNPTNATSAPIVVSASDGVVTYREALIGTVQRLNPLFASLNPVDRDITSLIFEGLTRTDEYGEARPALAERWVISSDGLEYTFFLRHDVLWQDGIGFNADDVIYTMSILRSPDFPGEEALGAFWRTVETERLDPYIVRFRLTQPLATFLDKVNIGILPSHALIGTGAEALVSHPFNLTPIGTGPYQLEALRTASDGRIQSVDLRVAPVYRQRTEGQSAPYALDRMRFMLFGSFDEALQALQDGNVDGLAGRSRADRTPLFLASNARGLASWNSLEPTVGVLIFNWDRDGASFFRERAFRIALETGLDRAAMVDRAFGFAAILADSPLIPGSWAHASGLPYPAYNADEARRLVASAAERRRRQQEADAAAGTPEATDEPNSPYMFSFALLTPNDPALVSVANEIASQWSQINVGVTVDAVDLTTYQSRLRAHDFDSAVVEYSMAGSSDPDPFAFWHQGEYPDGENYGGADDRTVSELLERARRDASGINRAEHYRAFQQEFISRAIAIPLYYPVYTYVTTPRLQGIQLGYIGSTPDRFRNIGQWSLSG
ncbi:MAG: ABC transporter substrate-binding protein [Anaerolineae bacterium]